MNPSRHWLLPNRYECHIIMTPSLQLALTQPGLMKPVYETLPAIALTKCMPMQSDYESFPALLLTQDRFPKSNDQYLPAMAATQTYMNEIQYTNPTQT